MSEGGWAGAAADRFAITAVSATFLVTLVCGVGWPDPVTVTTEPYAGWPQCVHLTNGRIELIATTDVGPRIIRFGFVGGDNIFREFANDAGTTGGSRWKPYGGHRLWHAPEEPTRTYQPDNAKVPYSLEGHLVKLRPELEGLTGIAKELDVLMSETDDAVSVTHRLVNRGQWEIKTAAWCLTMMAPGGRAIFPQEPFVPFPEQLLPARPLVLWSYTDMSDPRFSFGKRFIQLRQDPARSSPQKIGLGNTLGWGAYVRGDVVFLKTARFRPGAEYPDMGCSWETFTNADMLELESLGPMTRLAPGQAVEHTERWYLVRATIGESDSEVGATLMPLVEKTKDVPYPSAKE